MLPKHLYILFLSFLITFTNSQNDWCPYDCKCSNNTMIDCSHTSLSDFSFVTLLKNYTILKCEFNALNEIEPFPRGDIQELSLRFNHIEKISNRSFANLKDIKYLDLSNNLLTGESLLPETFEGEFHPIFYKPLPLQRLNLSHNSLTFLDHNLFEHLSFLKNLSLAYNPLSDKNGILERSTVVAICSITQLEVLDLSATGMAFLPETFLDNLQFLSTLLLAENNIKTVPFQPLSYGKNLTILNLNNNPIKIIDSTNRFPHLENLKELHLSHMSSLLRIEEDSLKNLTALKILECNNNPKLEYISNRALYRQKMLKLDLSDNNIHYIPEDLVPDWNSIEFIDFRGNSLSCHCQNQWILDKLIDLSSMRSDGLLCNTPEELKGMSLKSLADKNYKLQCINYSNKRPEKNSVFIVVIFLAVVVVLITIGATLKFLILKGGYCRRRRGDIDYTAIYQRHMGN